MPKSIFMVVGTQCQWACCIMKSSHWCHSGGAIEEWNGTGEKVFEGRRSWNGVNLAQEGGRIGRVGLIDIQIPNPGPASFIMGSSELSLLSNCLIGLIGALFRVMGKVPKETSILLQSHAGYSRGHIAPLHQWKLGLGCHKHHQDFQGCGTY